MKARFRPSCCTMASGSKSYHSGVQNPYSKANGSFLDVLSALGSDSEVSRTSKAIPDLVLGRHVMSPTFCPGGVLHVIPPAFRTRGTPPSATFRRWARVPPRGRPHASLLDHPATRPTRKVTAGEFPARVAPSTSCKPHVGATFRHLPASRAVPRRSTPSRASMRAPPPRAQLEGARSLPQVGCCTRARGRVVQPHGHELRRLCVETVMAPGMFQLCLVRPPKGL